MLRLLACVSVWFVLAYHDSWPYRVLTKADGGMPQFWFEYSALHSAVGVAANKRLPHSVTNAFKQICSARKTASAAYYSVQSKIFGAPSNGYNSAIAWQSLDAAVASSKVSKKG